MLKSGLKNEAILCLVQYVHVRTLEAKICSRSDIFLDLRLQRSEHGSNCARSLEQQDMLGLGYFSIPETFVARGDRKSHTMHIFFAT